MANYKLKVIQPVNIHSREQTISKTIGLADIGTYVATKVDTTGKMYYVPTLNGWISTNDATKVQLTSVVANDSDKEKGVQSVKEVVDNSPFYSNKQSSEKFTQESLEGIVTDSLESLLYSQINASIQFDASTRLFGQPFQFTPTTDTRISSELDLGRKYVETFVAEAPIVYILPGKATYLPELQEGERDAIKNVLSSATNAIEKAVQEDILNAEQRYFDFVPDYTSYMNYVNALCRVGASYMGIGDLDAPVKAWQQKYRYFNWANYKYEEVYKPVKGDDKVFTLGGAVDAVQDTLQKAFESWIGSYQYTQFYVDPSTSFQESSSNSSGTSAVQSLLEKVQGAVKEYSFMSTAASTMTGIPDLVGGTKQAIDSAIEAFSGGIFSKILTNTNVIIDGGNIMFPEIWGDSNYSKSYNISMNLVSPYGTKESIYLHVLVPLFHLLALSAPRQISSNGFGQPFFVKISSKGWFNCELGMVESISIEKVMGSYTVNGLPTEIRVDLSVKDLYSTMMVSSSTNPGLFFENKSLTNWLAVTCGLNIAEPNFVEKWKTVLTSMIAGAAMDIPGNMYEKVTETVRNKIRNIIGF